MYANFEMWEDAIRAGRRIYDPFSYRVVLQERAVPVCPAEAPGLARRAPVVWQRNSDGDLDLVVLRGLAADAPVPGTATLTRTGLPLLLQAYPLRFEDPDSAARIGIDAVAPARERDAGSYITDTIGTVLPGAELKLRALEAWRAGVGLRQRLTALVTRHELLEPVVLPADLVARHRLPDVFSVIAQPDDRLILGALPAADWPVAARFLAAQRMSLYTMAGLIARSEDPAA